MSIKKAISGRKPKSRQFTLIEQKACEFSEDNGPIGACSCSASCFGYPCVLPDSHHGEHIMRTSQASDFQKSQTPHYCIAGSKNVYFRFSQQPFQFEPEFCPEEIMHMKDYLTENRKLSGAPALLRCGVIKRLGRTDFSKCIRPNGHAGQCIIAHSPKLTRSSNKCVVDYFTSSKTYTLGNFIFARI